MSQFIPFLSVVVVCLCLSFTCCCGFWVANRFFRKEESNQTPPRIQETKFSPRRDSRREDALLTVNTMVYDLLKIEKIKIWSNFDCQYHLENSIYRLNIYHFVNFINKYISICDIS